MVVNKFEVKMPVGRHPQRVDILDLKTQIERKVGRHKAQKYFETLNRFFSLKISKLEFNKLCIDLLGRDNICLHNHLIRSILKNAFLTETTLSKESKTEGSLSVKVANGHQRSSLQLLCREVFPQSPRKGRTPIFRDRKFRDRPSPLGPHCKTSNVLSDEPVLKVQEQQSATELLSLGSKPPGEGNSVEDGEEVEQASGSPGARSRSPVKPPFGIWINMKGTKKASCNESASGCYKETCHYSGKLPDTNSLRTRLEKKLEVEGLNASVDCVNLLNSGLELFLKRLIRPTLQLARQQSTHKSLQQGCGEVIGGLNDMGVLRNIQNPNGTISASMLDFRVATELNPRILGEDWPTQLEKICLRSFEE